jgi:hypothetical protein
MTEPRTAFRIPLLRRSAALAARWFVYSVISTEQSEWRLVRLHFVQKEEMESRSQLSFCPEPRLAPFIKVGHKMPLKEVYSVVSLRISCKGQFDEGQQAEKNTSSH